MQEYFQHVASEIDTNSEDGTVKEVFGPILDRVKEKFQKEFSLGHGILYDYLDILLFFSRTSCLAQVWLMFIEFCPKNIVFLKKLVLSSVFWQIISMQSQNCKYNYLDFDDIFITDIMYSFCLFFYTSFLMKFSLSIFRL